ncbi:MAG: tetratricopeptide repeat protein [Gammaproteobacteria bacterium]|nr:tetratricopeptide repeat protein [Gammaproteobacteria bacterium]
MKIIILLSIFFIINSAFAEQIDSKVVVKEEKDNAFKGLFYTVWNKFKSLSPKNEIAVRNTSVTMGIRGAETTSTILQPYWKDDKTSDEKFMLQLEDFAKAQGMADGGDLESANKAFNDFITRYPTSDLKPNARFAEALTMGAMGENEGSIKSFKTFINEYPQHPLVRDAEQVMQELK